MIEIHSMIIRGKDVDRKIISFNDQMAIASDIKTFLLKRNMTARINVDGVSL